MPDFPITPRGRKTRARLIDAARAAMSGRGVSQVTMADVAEEAAFGQVFALSQQGRIPTGIIYRSDNCPTMDGHWRAADRIAPAKREIRLETKRKFCKAIGNAMNFETRRSACRASVRGARSE